METLVLFLLIIYGAALCFIVLYTMAQFHLLIHYLKARKKKVMVNDPDSWPVVTVQLPVYNEKYVVARLIEAVASIDYPGDRLEIQVLDDSDDETRSIISEIVAYYRSRNFDITQIRRDDREGFKAGALQYGLTMSRGKFIAIFDADFIPPGDFLKRTMPYFGDDQTGVVQTRWAHINRNYSIFTRAQAFALDAHFTVEQKGRNHGQCFINFNGTGGIWRKQTILDAGGWQSDTLTEDLDLSYRAQLKGWKFKFLEDVEAPAELPAEMGSIKSQQFRWTKGAAETARKLLPGVLKARLPVSLKIHAFFHLFNSCIFICILIAALLSIPALMLKNLQWYPLVFKIAGFCLVSLLAIGAIYFVSFKRQFSNGWKAIPGFLYMFPVFLSFSMGLSLHNAWAVIQGFAGIRTSFIRTPKFNLRSKKDGWKGKQYVHRKIGVVPVLEGLLTCYFLYGIVLAFQFNDYGLLPFHVMLSFGFGSIFLHTVYQKLQLRKISSM